MKKAINLTPSQDLALKKLKAFVGDMDAKVFILTGHAGTGKTTLLKSLVEWLVSKEYFNGAKPLAVDRQQMGRHFIPMASTGRAAKVLRDKIGLPASTVHGLIYDMVGFNCDIEKIMTDKEEPEELYLDFRMMPIEDQDAVYLIDEASMIGDTPPSRSIQARFGSGRLLSDLFAYNKKGKFIFIGDEYQLPPIDGDISPALSKSYIESKFNLNVVTAELKEIMRQGIDNDIISAADAIRKMADNPPQVEWGEFLLSGYKNIEIVDSGDNAERSADRSSKTAYASSRLEIVDEYVSIVRSGGYDDAILIAGSNKDCFAISDVARKRLGFTDSLLMTGELLLVTQNNILTGLMNGDLIRVTSIGGRQKRAGLTFLQVEVEELVSKRVYNTMLIEELLYSGTANLNQAQQKELYIDFIKREWKRGIKPKTYQFKSDIRQDEYLNALRAVFGYAITCHKAQGGEWEDVYLCCPHRLGYKPGRETCQWLYTAITRASGYLHVAKDYFIV